MKHLVVRHYGTSDLDSEKIGAATARNGTATFPHAPIGLCPPALPSGVETGGGLEVTKCVDWQMVPTTGRNYSARVHSPTTGRNYTEPESTVSQQVGIILSLSPQSHTR